MGKEAGKNVLLYIGDDGSPTTFNLLQGQKTTRLRRGGTLIDARDKDSNNWEELVADFEDGTVTVSGAANWPDSNGLEVLRSKKDSQSQVECKIVLNTAGANYIAWCYIEELDIDGPIGDLTSYDVTIRFNGQPAYAAS